MRIPTIFFSSSFQRCLRQSLFAIITSIVFEILVNLMTIIFSLIDDVTMLVLCLKRQIYTRKQMSQMFEVEWTKS